MDMREAMKQNRVFLMEAKAATSDKNFNVFNTDGILAMDKPVAAGLPPLGLCCLALW
jgi:hypothetical protein